MLLIHRLGTEKRTVTTQAEAEARYMKSWTPYTTAFMRAPFDVISDDNFPGSRNRNPPQPRATKKDEPSNEIHMGKGVAHLYQFSCQIPRVLSVTVCNTSINPEPTRSEQATHVGGAGSPVLRTQATGRWLI